ncbi:3-oxoacyl-[acyl-carrier-protein] reductase FabG-like [Saccoglossus kowalevskii]|uniref:Tropinone reductase 2-like n=1 Tax=Saccoglossus kowalevskii TaxID=10224 RepID=A0ABM0GNX8_SACKO|nr:PREDICTED: tropinone reductase 2-like [Saccoglossus kowalevskii]
MASLAGKVALITGASSGIGAGTAGHFASLGCYLALCGRNEENLQKVGTACEANGLDKDKVLLIVGDLSKEEDCKTAVEKTIQHFGQLDVLVNNAGILINGTIETATLEEYDTIMNINVRSMFHITMLSVPHLIKTKGSIVNVSSVAGLRSFPGILLYNMSKAAVDQFTNTVALELASKQVRVNSVNPGVIITEVHKRAGMSDEKYTEFLERSKTTHALGRPGTTEEVAKAIAFLASDDSSFITATQLPLDGGRHAMCPR